ncbi:uncharacterized protein UTRI_03997 [Ustilago trichophora]|uniref:Uncharacterized protein n=1 Tax=Ustilago trichophora TaxID=86804 RepID=A0A5C3E7G3_9BASI|nr:uncharacterized protein UTRI_03997 [Ustilago trichophora]
MDKQGELGQAKRFYNDAGIALRYDPHGNMSVCHVAVLAKFWELAHSMCVSNEHNDERVAETRRFAQSMGIICARWVGAHLHHQVLALTPRGTTTATNTTTNNNYNTAVKMKLVIQSPYRRISKT